MLIPSRTNTIVYMWSEFDFGGNFVFFAKQAIRGLRVQYLEHLKKYFESENTTSYKVLFE